MINFDKMYSAFEAPNTYNLLDSQHKLEFYIGMDDKGRKCLILRSKFKPEFIKSTSAIDISIGQVRNNIWSLGFHLVHNSMSGLFYKFCDDIVESSRNLPESVNGMSYVVKRYNSWKKLFYNLKKDLLSENEIMGLLGELLFLKTTMLKNYNPEVAINSWSGCDKTHKDFSVDNLWYEIKSTKSSSLTVKIHSIEQLDSNDDGHLVVFEFEKMSELFDGLSLNNLIRDLLNIIPDDLTDVFLEKLKSVGYNYDDGYDKYVYRISSHNSYLVNDDFPRIKKDFIPASIVKMEYEILKKDLYLYREVIQ